jgi:Zn-dependent peptidase ImmA (M78 family)
MKNCLCGNGGYVKSVSLKEHKVIKNFTARALPSLAAKLASARAASGLSTRAVKDQLGNRFSISHATIANYEKARTIPTLEVLAVLADVYERPLTWFFESGPSLSGIRYRNLKSKVRVGDRHLFEAKAQHWLEAYARLESRLGEPLRPQHGVPGIGLDQPEHEIARNVRKILKLRQEEPIPSIVAVLEHFGVRTIELPTELRIDGLAARFGSEFAVVLNPNTSNDRCRMNAAHELAHVLLGDCHTNKLREQEIERRAYGVASHLILPQRQLLEAFEGRSFVRLVQFKEKFGVSIAAMVYRAEQSGIIDPKLAKWIWIEFAKRGWRTKEPGHVRPDRARRFERLLEEALTGQKLSWREAESFLGVREKELRERLDFAMGISPVEDEDEEGGDAKSTIKIRP